MLKCIALTTHACMTTLEVRFIIIAIQLTHINCLVEC
jgi:hypothetical protein